MKCRKNKVIWDPYSDMSYNDLNDLWLQAMVKLNMPEARIISVELDKRDMDNGEDDMDNGKDEWWKIGPNW